MAAHWPKLTMVIAAWPGCDEAAWSSLGLPMARPTPTEPEGGHGPVALSARAHSLKHVRGHGGRDAEAGGGPAVLAVPVMRSHAEATGRMRRGWGTCFAVRGGHGEAVLSRAEATGRIRHVAGHGGASTEERGEVSGPH
jgi:hypothetical protein